MSICVIKTIETKRRFHELVKSGNDFYFSVKKFAVFTNFAVISPRIKRDLIRASAKCRCKKVGLNMSNSSGNVCVILCYSKIMYFLLNRFINIYF